MDIDKLIQEIKLYESILKQKGNTVSRKVLTSDINNRFINLPIKEDKIKGYRLQGEYGEKKFIKPWRTGTKSQQQPLKGSSKKNRGNK